MAYTPPIETLQLTAWVHCGEHPQLMARLRLGTGDPRGFVEDSEVSLETILERVREWLEAIEADGVTYCATSE